MKKFLSVILAFILCITFVACNNNNDDSGKKPPIDPDEEINEPSIEGENFSYIEGTPFPQFENYSEKIDYLEIIEGKVSDDLRNMIASLKAIVNSEEVSIYTRELANMPDWLSELGYKTDGTDNRVIVHENAWDLVEKYADKLNKIVIYDTEVMETLDLANTYAGLNRTLVGTYTMYMELRERGYNVEIVEDYRNQFENKYEVYNYLYENLWQDCSKRILISEATTIPGIIRSFGMTVKAAFVYLDGVKDEKSIEILEKFYGDMIAGESAVYGWYKVESQVGLVSRNGVMTYASDYLENLEFFAKASAAEAGISAPVYSAESMTEEYENIVYVSLIFSEGDNLCYNMRTIKNSIIDDPAFGTFPVTISASPAAAVLMPEILNYYYAKSNDNIGYMTGPSGLGYVYMEDLEKNAEAMEKFMKNTNRFMKYSKIPIVNNWYRDGWAVQPTDNVLDCMGQYYNDIFGVLEQSNVDAQMRENCFITNADIPYVYDKETQVEIFKQTIEAAIDEQNQYNWDQPIFLYIQGNPWTTHGMSDYKKVIDDLNTLYGDKICFGRLDETMRKEKKFFIDMQG